MGEPNESAYMDEAELINLLFSSIQHHNDSLLDDLLAAESAANLLDVPGHDGNTLMHVAIMENDLNCLACLLKRGANPNVFDATRARSPLHLAVELGQTETVKLFLSLQHVNLELRDDRNLTCYEIAQFCDNQTLADLISNCKQERERFKDEFYTVMNQACTSNEPRLVRELFERFEKRMINDLPADWHPYRDKRQYSRKMLAELINWSSSSWNDVTLLFKSASKGHTEICRLLINFGATAKCNDSTNYSPLYVAAYGGHTSTVRLLLDSFPSLIQEVTIEKWTVLHACSLQGHSETAKLILSYTYPEALKRRFVSRSGLYEYNFSFDLNAQDAAGQTAIYLAVLANNENLLDTLLAFNIEAKTIGNSQHNEQKNLMANRLIRSNGDREAQIKSSKLSNESQNLSLKQNLAENNGTSKINSSSHIDKIMRQLRRLQFSRENDTSESICVKDNEVDKYLICPFEMDTYCDYNSKTVLHLAVCQQYHNIATTLLVNGSNPNLPILFRDSIKSDSSSSSSNSSVAGGGVATGDIGLNWLRSSKSTCLKEACRLNDKLMCEILIRYGARDNQDNLALQVAAANKNHELISLFLSLKSNIDPEYKINRKCNVEFASRYKQSQKASKANQIGHTTTFSSMFPSTPVAINWQNLKCIQQLDPQWLIEASLAHNKRLRHPTNSLMALTRLDLSSNNLKSVHPVIFRLPSLRELDLSSNRLETLLDLNSQHRIVGDRDSVTSKLIESQRTAMKRSKSSNFTGRASLESSNVIDLNEPLEWDLPFLEVLDLHDNLLISLPDSLFGLPKLRELDVSSNQLRQLPWAMWTAPSLRELVAAGNLLEDLPKAPPHPNQSSFYTNSRLSTISDTCDEEDKNVLTNQSFDKLDASSLLRSSKLNPSNNSAYLSLLRDAKQLNETTLISEKIGVEHVNHWSRRIELANDTDLETRASQIPTADGEESDTTLSKLTYLNLSQNSLTSIPPVLACIATELTRLVMSYNRLNSLGDISLYPYKLKNLDLSNNQLTHWFQFSQQDDDTKHCYGDSIGPRKLLPNSRRSFGPVNLQCVHKLHQRLDNLRSLNLSHNHLREIRLYSEPTPGPISNSHSRGSQRTSHWSSPSTRTIQTLLYPSVTALDVSYNRIERVPENLCVLKDLSVLNLSGNTSITTLPPELGLASKLWNLGVNGCTLSEPLKSIVESKSYKTMDIIGYLRSILEEAKPYARMKLMLVGLQGIGKTSLLEQMRQEGSSGFRRRAPEHWTKRMGHTARSNLRNQKGVTLSTVGVDIHDWVYQRRPLKGQANFGPVSFSTWDFGGQEEFYATHRYFLSRRSIYLVVWRLTDGLGGILGIQQWLVNIQSRAPGSPVIIVGTHEDMIEGGERGELAQKLQVELHKRFIDVSDHDKCGLPRIMDSIVVSARTKLNVKTLCNRIYDVVFSLRCPGSTERLLEQKIPATYLYLEEIVSSIVHERHQRKCEPVLGYDEYKRLTSEQLKLKHNKTFRDLEPLGSRDINYNSELQQATRFLHENGVLLHYEDSNLRDLYFLDPQWLCDILSHVVTIREINPHVKNGLMKIDDLGLSFKSMDTNLSGGVQSYVVNLLNKFEVALTWNSQYLLIPSLLPDYPSSMFEQRDVQLKLAPRTRGRSVMRRQEANKMQAIRATSIDPLKRMSRQSPSKESADYEGMFKNSYEFELKQEGTIYRLVLLRYLPAGFLARLQSALLSDAALDDACEDLHFELVQTVLNEEQENVEFAKLIGSRPGWFCWKRGIRLMLQKESTINTKSDDDGLAPDLLTIEELSPEARDKLLKQAKFKIECPQINHEDDYDEDSGDQTQQSVSRASTKTKWIEFDMGQYSNIIAITLPNPKLKATRKADQSVRYFEFHHLIATKLLAKAVDYIDDLLEDWYPSLGARFAHTLGGNYLVTRIIPCRACSSVQKLDQISGAANPMVRVNHTDRPSRMSESRATRFSMISARDNASLNCKPEAEDMAIYCFYVEHCTMNAYDLAPLQNSNQTKFPINLNPAKKNSSRVRHLHCPRHGAIRVSSLAPDIVFDDIPEELKIQNDQIERCKLIGRGALGFVFKGSVHSAFPLNQLAQSNQEVALKLLQPVDPGPEADQADLVAYNSARTNWSREPFQCASKSYCTARHEVNILQTISHPNIVAFIGLCLRPLAIVLELAPLGSLADVFRNYKRACSRIDPFTVQKSLLQVAKALEFLHQRRVIYRDLKTENILVWSFPSPFATSHQSARVELKLADYGISRQALATGIWKGFAGTMSYLAPEILRHNGDEEYTEKVDCFSFGMFMYEMLTLRPPYKQAGGGVAPCGFAASRSQFASESGRPILQRSDLFYPNYMLDLMSLCWSQEPQDRPTASQIVSIASTPEFMQILDAVELDADSSQLNFSGAIEHASELNLWIGKMSSGQSLDILATDQGQWASYESFDFRGSKRITCMSLVGANIWLCDSEESRVHVLRADPRKVTQDEPLDKTTNLNRSLSEANEDLVLSSFTLRDRRGKPASLGQIKSLVYIDQAKCVIFLTGNGLLWLCKLATMVCEQLDDSSIQYSCIAQPSNSSAGDQRSNLASSPSSANLSGADSQPSSLDSSSPLPFQLFCGQSNGISWLEICDGEVRRQSILPLAGSGSQTSQEDSIDDSLTSAEISHIVTRDQADLLWTAADCTVHLWSLRGKHVIRKLDCWKLVPCSESLESINIEQYYQESRTSQVTSLVHMQDQLFVGTSHGCFIVIEANSLKPMTVFRPYESQVTILSPLSFGCHRMGDQSRETCHLVALGQGYRDLMGRYLMMKSDNLGPEDRKSKLVAIILTASSECEP